MAITTIEKHDGAQEYVSFNVALPSGNVGFSTAASFRKSFKDNPEKVHSYFTRFDGEESCIQVVPTLPSTAENMFKGHISLEVHYKFTKTDRQPVHLVGYMNLRGRLTERNTPEEIDTVATQVLQEITKVAKDDIIPSMTEDLAAELDAAEAA